jgi:TolB-like protein/class 3 adenylate cyclase/Tfp pilus assembly protein PilF
MAPRVYAYLLSTRRKGIITVCKRVNAQDTPADSKPDLPLEIAHLLLIDVVGYSKLLVNEQIELLEELNQIVRNTECFRAAEASGKFNRVSTGDGMALLFFLSPEEPVRCALEISKTLQDHPRIQVRMGVHSGPVNRVTDVNDKTNFAGSGINVAQRVLDCGDAGHILLSGHVAEDLAEYRHWQPHLHDLGECEVKHGLRLHIVNLYKDNLGNPQVPEKLKRGRWKHKPGVVRPISAPRSPKFVLIVALLVSAIALVVSSLIFFHPRSRSSAAVAAPGAMVTSAAAPIPEKSIAVLPLENLSDEKENAFFADGVQDEILAGLAKVADLKVISRTSTMHYKVGPERNLREIAKTLGVAHVLEGSVQRSGNRVRVNANLVDARTDRQLWAQTYDRDLADVFAIQSEIAKAIAEQLQAKLSPGEENAIERPPTGDIAAFDFYTRAQNLLLTTSFSSSAKANFLQAADLLNQAVAHDPSFFQAYCQLAYTHDALYSLGFDHTPARLGSAGAAVEAAFRLRPDAGETHLARAGNLYRGYLDYDGALAELEVARQTLPNDPRAFELKGYIERRQGRWEQSTRNLERAIELDPRNFFMLQQIAISYGVLRRYAEETSVLDRALDIEPNDIDTKTARAFVEFHWKADTRPLHQTIDSIRATNPDAVPHIAEDWLNCALAERDAGAAKNALVALGETPLTDYTVHLNRSVIEGVLARMTKHEGKARSAFTAARAEQEKTVQAEPDYGPPLCVLGLIDAGLGRKEEALREGRRAVELLPVEKDAINGPLMTEYLAMIAAWVGDKDLACEKLAIAVRAPSTVSYGQLKLLPFWDPLRGDPRFDKIVASLAPK